MSYFDTYGPLYIERDDGAFQGQQAAFWNDVESRYEGLTSAIGCYTFCLEYRGVIKPWYVGRTWAIKGFRGEVFELHKRNIYNDILQSRRGRPLIFLFPLISAEKYQFSKSRKSSKRVIEWLEIQLMGFAHKRNSEISNVKDMTFLRNVEVLGLIGRRRGRPFREAQAIRHALLGGPKPK